LQRAAREAYATIADLDAQRRQLKEQVVAFWQEVQERCARRGPSAAVFWWLPSAFKSSHDLSNLSLVPYRLMKSSLFDMPAHQPPGRW
jgi:hypothetical protein